MKKKILSLSLGLILLTGTSVLASPINTTSSGTTLYDYGDGKISSTSGTVTTYAVDTIKVTSSLYRGGILVNSASESDTNTHFVLASVPSAVKLSGITYSAIGYHSATHNGVTYTHTSTNPK